jgi:hypothetical protein
VSEQDSSTFSTEEKDEDVELHGKKKNVMASEEQRDDADIEDDVELHGKRRTM